MSISDFIFLPPGGSGFAEIIPTAGTDLLSTNGNVLTLTSTGNTIIITGNAGTNTLNFEATGGGGGGTPAGPDRSLQFNNSGSFGGSANLEYLSGGNIQLLGGVVYTQGGVNAPGVGYAYGLTVTPTANNGTYATGQVTFVAGALMHEGSYVHITNPGQSVTGIYIQFSFTGTFTPGYNGITITVLDTAQSIRDQFLAIYNDPMQPGSWNFWQPGTASGTDQIIISSYIPTSGYNGHQVFTTETAAGFTTSNLSGGSDADNTTLYTYQVVAVDGMSNQGIASQVSTSSGASALSTGVYYNTLNWDVSPTAVSWNIYRSAGPSGYSYGLIGNTVSNSFVDDGITGTGGSIPLYDTTTIIQTTGAISSPAISSVGYSGPGSEQFGLNSSATGTNCVVVGENSVASGTNSVVIGEGSNDGGQYYPIVIGSGLTATQPYQILLGGSGGRLILNGATDDTTSTIQAYGAIVGQTFTVAPYAGSQSEYFGAGSFAFGTDSSVFGYNNNDGVLNNVTIVGTNIANRIANTTYIGAQISPVSTSTAGFPDTIVGSLNALYDGGNIFIGSGNTGNASGISYIFGNGLTSPASNTILLGGSGFRTILGSSSDDGTTTLQVTGSITLNGSPLGSNPWTESAGTLFPTTSTDRLLINGAVDNGFSPIQITYSDVLGWQPGLLVSTSDNSPANIATLDTNTGFYTLISSEPGGNGFLQVYNPNSDTYAEFDYLASSLNFLTTASNYGARVSAMYIDSSQNVGIGTTTPGANLEILRDGGSTTGVTDPNAVLILDSGGGATNFWFNVNASANNSSIYFSEEGTIYAGFEYVTTTKTNPGLWLTTDGSGSPTTGLRLNADGSGVASFMGGSFGIGTLTPAYPLDVAGSIGVSGNANVSSAVVTPIVTTNTGDLLLESDSGLVNLSGNFHISGFIQDDTFFNCALTSARQLILNDGTTVSLDWQNTKLFDNLGGAQLSIDWSARLLIANDGTSTNLDYSTPGQLNSGAVINLSNPTTVYGGDTSGDLVYSMPFQGLSYKKWVGNLQNLVDSGVSSIFNFATPFTNTPYVYGDAAAIAGVTVTTTQITFPATAGVTGNVFVEGF